MSSDSKELQGVYKFYWDQLKDSDFVRSYFDGSNQFKDYLHDPTEENAYKFVKAMTERHEKTNSSVAGLSAMTSIEKSLGQLHESHRAHLVHSINVFLLGLCIFERLEGHQATFSRFPGYQGNNGEAKKNFRFRWLLASLFHDVGYVFELPAKGFMPDGLDITWGENEELQRGLKRLKFDIQRSLRAYIGELREFPVVKFKEGYDNNNIHYFPETNHRKIKEDKDILRLFAYLFVRLQGNKLGTEQKIFEDLQQTLNHSFTVGIDSTFDHGKIGAFLFLHEMRTLYQNARANSFRNPYLSWHRANLYYEIMDAALAIYLHNTYRYYLLESWGKCNPERIPPLSYLLTLCDLLVEWDRPSLGYYRSTEVNGSQVELTIDGQNEFTVKYNNHKDIADKVRKSINEAFDDEYLKVNIPNARAR